MPDDPTAADALAQADAIVEDSVAQADAIVEDSLAQADATVEDSLAQADATVEDSLAQADATVEDALTRADTIVDDTLAEADRTVTDALARGERTPADDGAGAPAGPEAATGGPAVASDQTVAAPTSRDAPPIDAPGSASGAPEESLARFDGDPTGAGPAVVQLDDLPFGGELLPSAGPFAESPFAGRADAVPIDAATPPAVGGASQLDAIVTTATDPAVMTATGVAVLVGGGVNIWRGAPQLPEAPIMFTNIRLLPCLIRDSVVDQIGAITAALGGPGPESAVQVPVSPASVTPRGVVAEASASNGRAVAESAGRMLDRFGASLREGFGHAVEGRRELGAAVADSRLMIQLGMFLGCMYAAFLSAWFWATRAHHRGGA